MNEGAMTGRGRGTCAGVVDSEDQGFSGRGYGMGRKQGRRGYQVPGGGRGSGYRATSAPVSTSQDALQEKVNMLEAELSVIKDQLKN